MHRPSVPTLRPASGRALEHERAFRRWSLPAGAVAAPETDPPSFRVYTAEQLRVVPLRPSSRPTAPLAAGPRARFAPSPLLQALGIGVALGLLGVTACLLGVALTDDPHVQSAGARLASAVVVVAPTPAPVQVPAPAAPVADEPAMETFELDEPAATTAPRAPEKRPVARLAVRDVPF